MKSFFMDCTTYLCNIICLYIFLRKQNQEFRLNKDCDITVYDIETIVIALQSDAGICCDIGAPQTYRCVGKMFLHLLCRFLKIFVYIKYFIQVNVRLLRQVTTVYCCMPIALLYAWLTGYIVYIFSCKNVIVEYSASQQHQRWNPICLRFYAQTRMYCVFEQNCSFMGFQHESSKV